MFPQQSVSLPFSEREGWHVGVGIADGGTSAVNVGASGPRTRGVSDVAVRRAGGPRAALMPDKTEEIEEVEEYADYSPPF